MRQFIYSTYCLAELIVFLHNEQYIRNNQGRDYELCFFTKIFTGRQSAFDELLIVSFAGKTLLLDHTGFVADHQRIH